MDDLPTTAKQSVPPMPPGGGVGAVGSMAKEVAPIVSPSPEAPTATEVGREEELAPEVSGAGVTMRSDTIVLPKPVQQLGVTPVGPSAPPVSSAPAIVLPLSDEKIAEGLHQSIQTSWRWLAEWCRRQLEGVHLSVRTIHGKIVRAKSD